MIRYDNEAFDMFLCDYCTYGVFEPELEDAERVAIDNVDLAWAQAECSGWIKIIRGKAVSHKCPRCQAEDAA
jgi:hypothetical protein